MMSTLDLFITPFALRHLANHAAGKKLDKNRTCFQALLPRTPILNVGPNRIRQTKNAYRRLVRKQKNTTTTTLKWGKGVVHVCYGTCCIDDKIGTPKSYSIIYQVFSCRVDHLDVANRFTRSLNHALNHSVTQSLTLSMNHLVTRSPKHSISQRVRHSLTCSITQLLNHSLIKHSLTH